MVISLNQCNGALMEEKVSARYAGCGNYTKKEKENIREDSLTSTKVRIYSSRETPKVIIQYQYKQQIRASPLFVSV